MSQELSLGDTSTAAEYASLQPPLETPQFSTNLFAGPCFGDLSPAESSPATLLDAPSPSPLLLNSFADSSSQVATTQSAPSERTEDRIDFDAVDEIADDMSSSRSSRPDSTHNPIHDLYDSTVTSLMNSSPADDLHRAKSTSAAAELSPLLLTSPATIFGSTGPMLHADDVPDISSTLISLDEASPVLKPLGPSNIEPESFQFFEPLGSSPPSNAHESDMHEMSSTLDEYSPTETLTKPFPVDFTSDDNVDMLDGPVLPSSSPINEATSSPTFPLTPPAYSRSQSHVIDSLSAPTASPLHIPLTPERLSSVVSDPLSSSAEIPVHFAPSLPSSDISSSPPTSSPEPIFSSSPPTASDSSVLFEDHHFTVPKSESELDTHTLIETTNSSPPSSSPQQHSSPLIVRLLEEPSPFEDDFTEPPPPSSPFQSSSPSPQFMELTEEPPLLKLDEVDDKTNLSEVQKASVQVTSPPNPTSLGIETSKTVLPEPMDAADSSHKRKREEEQEGEAREEIATQPPNPKRPTLASQKLQRQTLAKPFRSPAMKPKAPEPIVAPPAPKKEVTPLAQPSNDSDLKKKHRTQRAAGQFKSPLPLSASSSIPSAVRQTPTIQALERKVQVLKRAVKVTKEGEEQTLEGLVKKWTEAGREVAWEVWGLIKDNQSGSGDGWGKDSQEAGSGKRRFEDSWGWNEDSGSKRVKVEERNWGWDVSAATEGNEHSNEQRVEAIEEDKPQETLGTMLMRLGIAPTTLGWNEEEGEFVDE